MIRVDNRRITGTYEKTFFEQHGVLVHEIPFPDGDPPSTDVITEFLGVRSLFLASGNRRDLGEK